MAIWRQDFQSSLAGSALFLEGGVSVQSETISLTPHVHLGYELHFIDSGKMTVYLDGDRRLVASGGDLMLTGPGVRHRGEHDVIPRSRLLWLVVAPLHPQAALGSCLVPVDLLAVERALREAGNTVIAAPQLRPRYRAIQRLLREREQNPGPQLDARLRGELSLLVLEAAEALSGGNQQVASEVTLKALHYLNEHLDAVVAVPKLARELGFSPSRFYQVFLAETGETPAACHMRLRIKCAAEALRQWPERRIAEVAATLGFSDQRYFATCFKRQTGMTPSAFRALEATGNY